MTTEEKQAIAREGAYWISWELATIKLNGDDSGAAYRAAYKIILAAIEKAYNAGYVASCQSAMRAKAAGEAYFGRGDSLQECLEQGKGGPESHEEPLLHSQDYPKAPRPSGQDTANVHIEHYFPKGYNPNEEPWKSIRNHHTTALAARPEPHPSGQEWTVETVDALWADTETFVGGFTAIANAHNAALADAQLAAQRRTNQLLEEIMDKATASSKDANTHLGGVSENEGSNPSSRGAQSKLLQARAAMQKMVDLVYDYVMGESIVPKDNLAMELQCIVDETDDTALREHDAEVRKPLVEALEKILEASVGHGYDQGFVLPCNAIVSVIDDALAKVEENKVE